MVERLHKYAILEVFLAIAHNNGLQCQEKTLQ
jgi:hypothetical protein